MIQDAEILTQRLITATGLAIVLGTSRDTLDHIQQVASGFTEPGNGCAFTLAAAAARRGCYALNAARSMPDDAGCAELPVCLYDGDEQAAQVLATLAGLVRRRLAQACGQAADRDDLRACGAGAGAAAEARALLLTAEGEARYSTMSLTTVGSPFPKLTMSNGHAARIRTRDVSTNEHAHVALTSDDAAWIPCQWPVRTQIMTTAATDDYSRGP